MSFFVKYPNLPCDSGLVLVGEKYLRILEPALERFGISVVGVPENPFVDSRLSSHADLSVCHGGDNIIFAASYIRNTFFERSLKEKGFQILFVEEEQKAEYPHDCQLNVCSAGEYIVYCPTAASNKIIDHFIAARGLNEARIRQGYSKCSICPVDGRSVITADSGAAEKLRAAGFDVLQIEPGYIVLEGFTYGFIGGAAFKMSSRQMAFTGSLDKHPDKNKIFSFLEKRDIMPVFLTDMEIFDVGSIIPVKEK